MEPSFIQFLKLLGFQDQDPEAVTKPILNQDLFQLPNRDAFHRIIYFLFQTLDPEKSITEFRDCWPIIEKRQEAEFRRNSFAWYKDLQLENPEKLPHIQASLFQSPGGRKFLNFISSFVRFVVLTHLKSNKENSTVWDFNILKSRCGHSLALSVLPQLIKENNTITQQCYEKLVSKQEKGQVLLDLTSNNYRDLRSKLKDISASNTVLLSSTGIQFEPGSAKSIKQSIEILSQRCLEKKNMATVLREQFDQIASESNASLDLIDSITTTEPSKCCLNLQSHMMSDEDNVTVPEIFDKLLDHVTTTEMDLSTMSVKNTDVPVEELRRVVKTVSFHKDKYSSLEHHLEKEVTPALENKIAKLRTEMEGIDWKQVFGRKSLAETESPEFAIPPSPGVQLIDRTKPDLPAKSFLLGSGRESSLQTNLGRPISPVEEEIRTNNKTLSDIRLDQSLNQWKKLNLPELGCSNDMSDHFLPPTRSNLFPRSNLPSTKSVSEESKLSVFSPILSSSRYELSVNMPPKSGALSDKMSHSFLFSDSAAITPTTLPKVKVEEEILEVAEFCTPDINNGGKSKHRTFRLSPRVFEDCDNMQNVGKGKRRDSGLVQFISKLERVSLGGLSPVTATDRKVKSRFNDLLSTLSLSPTQNLLFGTNDSCMEMSAMEDL